VHGELSLTPAYDICPQARGSEARQAMAFTRGTEDRPGIRDSHIDHLVAASSDYHLPTKDARSIVEHQIDVIRSDWADVCEMAELTGEQRNAFMGTQFLNDFALS